MDRELRVHVERPPPNRQEFSQTVCYRDGSPLHVCGWVYEHRCTKQTRKKKKSDSGHLYV